MTVNLTSGRTTVTSAGTAVPLAAAETSCLWVTVTALTSNTGQVNVGAATVIAAAGAGERGIPLLAGDSVDFDITNLAKVWIDSRVSGEGVGWTYGR